MFPHTPHVESVSLLERVAADDLQSGCPGQTPVSAADGRAPEQVGVRRAGSRARSPGSAGRPSTTSHQVDATIVSAEARDACRATSQSGRRPKRTRGARGRRAKKSDVGQAELRRAAARDDERDRERAEDVLVVLGDRLRRAAPDRVRVDPRDQQRDEHDPRELLEERCRNSQPKSTSAPRTCRSSPDRARSSCQKHDREHEEAERAAASRPRPRARAAARARRAANDRRHEHERDQQRCSARATSRSEVAAPARTTRRAPRASASRAAARPTRGRRA